MNEISSRYATSLYELALEASEVSEWQNEIKELKELFVSNQEFLSIISSPFLSIEDRYSLLDKTLKGVKQEIVSLIKIIIKNHRENLLISIFDAFNSLANEYRGVKEGLLFVTENIDKKLKEEIEKSIGKNEGCKVELITKIDPSLIGGLKVVINGHIYDSSIKTTLSNLKDSLLRK